ncbi:MAG: gas vesicle protein [Actinomycetota bacterium]|nr:gas vesicle protein [Actinomycetota bacterium]
MSVGQERPGPLRYAGQPSGVGRGDTTNLADLLERILDKGIVIAGDISISLVDVELLTIKIRLLIASVDKAREMGVNWWESDPWLSSRAADQRRELDSGDSDAVANRLERLEAAIDRLQMTAAGRGDGPGEDRRK